MIRLEEGQHTMFPYAILSGRTEQIYSREKGKWVRVFRPDSAQILTVTRESAERRKKSLPKERGTAYKIISTKRATGEVVELIERRLRHMMATSTIDTIEEQLNEPENVVQATARAFRKLLFDEDVAVEWEDLEAFDVDSLEITVDTSEGISAMYHTSTWSTRVDVVWTAKHTGNVYTSHGVSIGDTHRV